MIPYIDSSHEAFSFNVFISKENNANLTNVRNERNKNLRNFNNNFDETNNKNDYSQKELNYGLIMFVMFHFLVLMFLICLSMTILKNPGFLEKEYVK